MLSDATDLERGAVKWDRHFFGSAKIVSVPFNESVIGL